MTNDKPTIAEAVELATKVASSWGWINEFEAMGAKIPAENEWELFTHNVITLRDQLSQIITSWGLDDTQPIQPAKERKPRVDYLDGPNNPRFEE